jgi:hypothetical protein
MLVWRRSGVRPGVASLRTAAGVTFILLLLALVAPALPLLTLALGFGSAAVAFYIALASLEREDALPSPLESIVRALLFRRVP